jgi:UDP-N-acetylmuramate: L-alanyl-gamma-D-glutamyl-meso-diaminopimelate ligase
LAEADEVIFYQPTNVDWALTDVAAQCRAPARVVNDIEVLVRELAANSGTVHILIMSNGGFGGLHQKLVSALQ